MRFLFTVALLLLASPAFAQTPPDLDEDGCIALSKTLDAKEKRREKPTAKEQAVYDDCIGWFKCDQADAGWEANTRTNELLLRHVMASCGHEGTK